MKLYRVDLTETKTTHMVIHTMDEKRARTIALARANPDWFENPDTRDIEVTSVIEQDG